MTLNENMELAADPATEVEARAKRRTYTTEYKMEILRQADQCHKHGEVGALLRREGLYASVLTLWRRQREAGMLSHMKSKHRGRKPKLDERDKQIQKLECENERLRRALKQAETIIDVQKKISDLLGVEQPEYKSRS